MSRSECLSSCIHLRVVLLIGLTVYGEFLPVADRMTPARGLEFPASADFVRLRTCL